MHFYDLLTDLYESFSPEKAEETVSFIRQELSFEVLYEQYDGQTLRTLINDHHEAFYECLARELVEDLDREPLVYFRDWQPLLAFFDRRSTQLLYYYAGQQSCITDIHELIQGLRLLDSGQYQAAIHGFHHYPHYMRHYFIGRCYIALGTYENAIRQYDLFLNALVDYWPLPENETDDDQELHYYLMAQWHIFKDLAYCHTQLGNYEEAQMNYELAFNYFTSGNIYVLSQGRFGQEAQLFHTMMSQYLLALEKTGRHDTALEYATFAVKHYPYDAYYTSVQQRCEAALGQQDFADHLLT
jgi:tetratricopeptide (TPR) repeat protein